MSRNNKTSMRKRIICTILSAMCILGIAACGKKDSKEQDAYRQFGINCLESGKYQEAVDAFDKALGESLGHVDEKELDICFYKARAQYLNGDTDAALDTYNAIIEYNEDARAYYLRGNLYFNTGDQEKAVADYKTAIKNDKSNYELYIGIYETFKSRNMAEDGQQYLNQAMELTGDKPKDCLYKGRICYLLGDYDEAVTYLEKALEGEQELAPYYLGQAYEALGDEEKAQGYIAQYLDSGVATSYDLYELGTTEMSEGDYEQALTYYLAGLSMESVPNKQNLMKSAIVAYEYSGDFDGAGKLMEEYISLYPSDEAAQKESTFLETR